MFPNEPRTHQPDTRRCNSEYAQYLGQIRSDMVPTGSDGSVSACKHGQPNTLLTNQMAHYCCLVQLTWNDSHNSWWCFTSLLFFWHFFGTFWGFFWNFLSTKEKLALVCPWLRSSSLTCNLEKFPHRLTRFKLLPRLDQLLLSYAFYRKYNSVDRLYSSQSVWNYWV